MRGFNKSNVYKQLNHMRGLVARLHRHRDGVGHDRVFGLPPERTLQLLPEREAVEHELERADLWVCAPLARGDERVGCVH